MIRKIFLCAALACGSFPLFTHALSARAQQPGIVVQMGHSSRIFSLAFSYDNKLLATGGQDKRIVLWDVVSGLEVRSLAGHNDSVTYTAFLDNNTLLSSSSDNQSFATFKMWDLATGRELSSFGSVSQTYAVNLKTRIVAGIGSGAMGYKDAIIFWDIQTGRELTRINAIQRTWANLKQLNEIEALAFSPDEKSIASLLSHGTMIVWDVKSGLKRRIYRNTPCTGRLSFLDETTVLCFQRGKTFLSSSKLIYFDLTTRKLIPDKDYRPSSFDQLLDSSRPQTSSPDGKLHATVEAIPRNPTVNYAMKILDYDDLVKIRDSATGRELKTLRGHSSPTESVAFAADGKSITSGYQKDNSSDLTMTFKVWDFTNGRGLRTINEQPKVSALSRDQKILAIAGIDKTVKILNPLTAEVLKTLGPLCTSAFSIAISPDNQFIATGDWCNEIRVWEIATGKIRWQAVVPSQLLNPIMSLSFSADGSKLVSKQNFNAVWMGYANARKFVTVKVWDSATGKELQSVNGDTPYAVFTPDGQAVAGTSSDYRVQLFDLSSGREWRVGSHSESIVTAAFSDDGKLLATGGKDNRIKLWDFATGAELRSINIPAETGLVAFSHSARLIASVDADSGVHLWNVKSGEELKNIKTRPGLILFSPDDTILAIANDSREVKLLGVSTGNISITLKTQPQTIFWSIAFSADGKRLVSLHSDGSVRTWDVKNGHLIKSRKMFSNKNEPSIFILSPDGKMVAAEMPNDELVVWEIATGQKLKTIFMNGMRVEKLNFSVNGKRLACVCESANINKSTSDTVAAWDIETGKRLKMAGGFTYFVALSPDGNILLTTVLEPSIKLWDIATGAVLRRLERGNASPLYSYSLAISPDGTSLATGDNDLTIRLIEVKTGAIKQEFKGHTGAITSVDFSPDGRMLASSGRDGLTNIWDVAGGNRIASLIALDADRWVVVTPDSRFDTNSLERIEGVNWIMPDDIFTPLPPEIFMRPYYEPRLLPRLLADDDFREVPSMPNLNRVQPVVTIADVKKDGPGTVTVIVEVENVRHTYQRAGNPVVESGAKDLRLFRDGQLVSYRDGDLFAKAQPASLGCEPIAGGSKKCRAMFEHIRLPQQKDVQEVEFSAYAFNASDVKSETFRLPFEFMPELSPRKGRVYLITVGVSQYENSDWNLEFAANDAHLVEETVVPKLRATGDYDEVVNVTLTAEEKADNGQKLLVKNATKENFRKIMQLLAGEKLPESEISEIPNAAKIEKATPDDVVMIFYSSHGYRDTERFYLFPYDTGPGQGRDPEAVVPHSISSDDLYQWLRNIDAGDSVLVIDACHAAAVTGKEFKPGPMGSRGMGQLAYDKGMRILAATQPDTTAAEVDNLDQKRKIQHGLLTYALVADGLIGGQADSNGDKLILLSEWLQYGVTGVPKLYAAAAESQNATVVSAPVTSRGGSQVRFISKGEGDLSTQQPSLFDFTDKLKRKRQLAVEKVLPAIR